MNPRRLLISDEQIKEALRCADTMEKQRAARH